METKDIKDLDVSRMLISPNNPQIVNWIDKNVPRIKNIKIKEKKGFTRAMIYKYIVLMYGANSPIQAMSSLDWWGQKWEACAYIGFPQKKSKNDGQLRFDECVLDMVLGNNEPILDMIILYIKWTNQKEWDYIVYLNEAMAGYLLDAMQNKQEKKTIAEVKLLRQEKVTLEREMSKEAVETPEFVSRFYHQIESSRLAIRPEDYAHAITSGDDFRGDNPYSVSYTLDQLKHAGDKIPNE